MPKTRKIAVLTYYLSCREHLFSSIVISKGWNSCVEKETLHRSSYHTKKSITATLNAGS